MWASPLNAGAVADREALFQVAAFNTFSAGNYDGYMPYSELSKHGDFGIGTFHGLDDEMIALNGIFYQIPVDGKPRQAAASSKAPYATVAFFEADQTLSVAGSLNYSGLMAAIDALLPTDGAIYAIKISATYDYAQTWSVPVQIKPYPPLAEAIKNQSVFAPYMASREPRQVSGSQAAWTGLTLQDTICTLLRMIALRAGTCWIVSQGASLLRSIK